MADSRVIVALDFADAPEALAFAARVNPSECRLKIGLELFTAAGPDLVTHLVTKGFDVFLDLKFHDIPNTVSRACLRAANLGVWMLNVHTLGGGKMLDAAREAIDRASHRPHLIGVTLLTSHGEEEACQIGLRDDVKHCVQRLAKLARHSRLDGVVCSAQEAAALREQCGNHFLLVTPGIRLAGSPADDQQRTLTPAEAIAQGADYLVIGRPITRAADPLSTLAAINREILVH